MTAEGEARVLAARVASAETWQLALAVTHGAPGRPAVAEPWLFATKHLKCFAKEINKMEREERGGDREAKETCLYVSCFIILRMEMCKNIA